MAKVIAWNRFEVDNFLRHREIFDLPLYEKNTKRGGGGGSLQSNMKGLDFNQGHHIGNASLRYVSGSNAVEIAKKVKDGG